MAEVELEDEREEVALPDFIGLEVTGDARFYNRNMRRNPFSAWRDTLPEEYR
jgi:CYTH domain-containing protein